LQRREHPHVVDSLNSSPESKSRPDVGSFKTRKRMLNS
jgi:hypothetical protein